MIDIGASLFSQNVKTQDRSCDSSSCQNFTLKMSVGRLDLSVPYHSEITLSCGSIGSRILELVDTYKLQHENNNITSNSLGGHVLL